MKGGIMQGGFFEDFAINSEVISMGGTVTEVEDGSTIQIGIGAVSGRRSISSMRKRTWASIRKWFLKV